VRIALGSDEKNELTGALERDLRARGHQLVLLGALQPGADDAWPSVGHGVADAVASGACEYGVVCCWSGTGVTIAANKVPGARAALCTDRETAELARVWNDANVLALSLRTTTPQLAASILDAWFAAKPTEDPVYRPMIDRVERSG
jgi:ribose 5-phosphate isomerase B